jgi:uncharacterized protein YdeI (YjbR/CyaY-like superfamily)
MELAYIRAQGNLAGMAAFKKHVSFGFMKGPLLKDPEGLFKNAACESIFTIKATKTSELPADQVLIDYMAEAFAINEQGAKLPRSMATKKKARPPTVPPDLAAALKQKKHQKARETFDNLSPSHRKEYIEWLTEAKREETRAKRLATTLEWLGEGKPRNWKYMRK